MPASYRGGGTSPCCSMACQCGAVAAPAAAGNSEMRIMRAVFRRRHRIGKILSLWRAGVGFNTLSPHGDAAPGEGVGGDGRSGIGAGIERILASFERAHLKRADDVVASVAHCVQGDIDTGNALEGIVVVEDEREEHSLGAVVAILRPGTLLIGEVEERLGGGRPKERPVGFLRFDDTATT